MSVALEIEDGDPWWLSSSLWTVPGPDPEGPPGSPIAGSPCYLWARVRNTGSTAVTNASVRVYWANPAVGFDRTTANLVGSAFVTLAAGETSDVLCLSPWIPTLVNEGHECILAEAFHSSLDPLPGVPAFNVPTDRHVAQRNLAVVMALAGQVFSTAFEAHNPSRKVRMFDLVLKEGKFAQIEKLVPLLGRKFQLPKKQGRLLDAGFVRSPCPDARTMGEAVPRVDRLELGPFGRAGYSIVGRLEGGATLVHVVQEHDGQLVGGISLLVLVQEEEKR